MSYAGIVCRLSVEPHPDPEVHSLAVGNVNGARVIVSKATPDNALGVYFPPDGQLSEKFCQEHDLISYTDENGVKKGGYFDKNRRVRSQKFRGVKSEGFWVPISYFNFVGISDGQVKEGDLITTVNGVPICNKYYSPATLRAMKEAKAKGVKFKVVENFPEHWDTPQFRFVEIKPDSLIYITEKQHGTSFRCGRVPVKQNLNLFQRLINKFIPVFKEYQHEFVFGSRRVVLETEFMVKDNAGYYGGKAPYSTHVPKLKDLLKEDEVVYGEIVGYLPTGSPLFRHSCAGKPELKDLKKKYGDDIVYSYGNEVGQSELYIYRITQNGVELSWNQVVARAKQLGVQVVPQISVEVFDGNRAALNEKVEKLMEGDSLLSNKHLREGVCLRVESPDGIRIVKAKSWTFGVLEGYIKSDDSYVDAEEIA